MQGWGVFVSVLCFLACCQDPNYVEKICQEIMNQLDHDKVPETKTSHNNPRNRRQVFYKCYVGCFFLLGWFLSRAQKGWIYVMTRHFPSICVWKGWKVAPCWVSTIRWDTSAVIRSIVDWYRFVDYLLAYILKNTRLCFCLKDMTMAIITVPTN